MIVEIFVLLVLFQLKHFVADYLLQNSYMLGKFKEKGWVQPLLAHVSVHGFYTLLIVVLFSEYLWLALVLAVVDMVIHFAMDRIKASPAMLGRYNVQEKEFWWSLGLDQAVHHLTHYLIIYFIVTT